jgi:hypothetical protein
MVDKVMLLHQIMVQVVEEVLVQLVQTEHHLMEAMVVLVQLLQ